jgi:hypothetical protein
MSKRLTEQLLKEVFRVADGSSVRKELSKNKHLVTITFDNIKEAYKDSYNRLREKDTSLPDPKGWKVFDSAAKAAITNLEAHLKNKRTKSNFAPGTNVPNGIIVYVSNKNAATPLNIIKNTAVSYINTKLKEYNKSLTTAKDVLAQNPNISKKGAALASQVGQYKAAISIHHKKTTIGAAQLAKSLAFISDKKYFSDFMNSSEIASLRDIFGDFDLKFEVDSDLNVSINEKYVIFVDIASYRKNFAGSEPNDWVNIKPKLEEAINKWASKQDWWNRKGSRSLKEDSVDLIGHTIVTNLAKNSLVRAVSKPKKPKRAPKPVKTTITGSSKKRVKKSKARPANLAAKKGVASSPLYLIGVLNQQLPRTIAKNMGDPRLNYRTGRFASSVQVTDIATTAKGFPSIGYTYDKFPYQTFEPGYRQGSVERDPRKLIDASIREIATQFAIGRFYTRRV